MGISPESGRLSNKMVAGPWVLCLSILSKPRRLMRISIMRWAFLSLVLRGRARADLRKGKQACLAWNRWIIDEAYAEEVHAPRGVLIHITLLIHVHGPTVLFYFIRKHFVPGVIASYSMNRASGFSAIEVNHSIF